MAFSLSLPRQLLCWVGLVLSAYSLHVQYSGRQNPSYKVRRCVGLALILYQTPSVTFSPFTLTHTILFRRSVISVKR